MFEPLEGGTRDKAFISKVGGCGWWGVGVGELVGGHSSRDMHLKGV